MWWPLETYGTNVETAMTSAKQAASDEEVSGHGAAVLLGPRRQLVDGLDPEHIELERILVLEGEHGVTHLRYRVRHGA
jgi:hypothetical protein